VASKRSTAADRDEESVCPAGFDDLRFVIPFHEHAINGSPPRPGRRRLQSRNAWPHRLQAGSEGSRQVASTLRRRLADRLLLVPSMPRSHRRNRVPILAERRSRQDVSAVSRRQEVTSGGTAVSPYGIASFHSPDDQSPVARCASSTVQRKDPATLPQTCGPIGWHRPAL